CEIITKLISSNRLGIIEKAQTRGILINLRKGLRVLRGIVIIILLLLLNIWGVYNQFNRCNEWGLYKRDIHRFSDNKLHKARGRNPSKAY
ncbi:MAG: hypothetical protein HY999_06600, partial [Nitrospinae bacterium]|nr:hypothetical protein [Nitrospinota bacterium]